MSPTYHQRFLELAYAEYGLFSDVAVRRYLSYYRSCLDRSGSLPFNDAMAAAQLRLWDDIPAVHKRRLIDIAASLKRG